MKFKFKILNKLKQAFNTFFNQDRVAKYGDKIKFFYLYFIIILS